MHHLYGLFARVSSLQIIRYLSPAYYWHQISFTSRIKKISKENTEGKFICLEIHYISVPLSPNNSVVTTAAEAVRHVIERMTSQIRAHQRIVPTPNRTFKEPRIAQVKKRTSRSSFAAGGRGRISQGHSRDPHCCAEVVVVADDALCPLPSFLPCFLSFFQRHLRYSLSRGGRC